MMELITLSVSIACPPTFGIIPPRAILVVDAFSKYMLLKTELCTCHQFQVFDGRLRSYDINASPENFDSSAKKELESYTWTIDGSTTTGRQPEIPTINKG